MTRARPALPRLWAVVRLAAWTAGLLVAGRLLLAAGTGSLAVPLGSSDELSAWLSATPPADMAMALARLAGLAAVGYLLLATALAVVADQVRARPLVAVAAALSPAVVRRIATGGTGLGLVLGGVVASLPAPDLHAGSAGREVALAADPATAASPDVVTATMSRWPDATATMARLPADHAVASTAGAATMPGTTSAEGEATMVRVDDHPTATMTPMPAEAHVQATPAAHRPTAQTEARPPAVPDIDPTLWIVEPDDSFWSIAEEVTDTGSTTGDERVVVRYWERLVEANRADLVDPDNPDLLVPGQRLVVPPPDGSR